MAALDALKGGGRSGVGRTGVRESCISGIGGASRRGGVLSLRCKRRRDMRSAQQRSTAQSIRRPCNAHRCLCEQVYVAAGCHGGLSGGCREKPHYSRSVHCRGLAAPPAHMQCLPPTRRALFTVSSQLPAAMAPKTKDTPLPNRSRRSSAADDEQGAPAPPSAKKAKHDDLPPLEERIITVESGAAASVGWHSTAHSPVAPLTQHRSRSRF